MSIYRIIDEPKVKVWQHLIFNPNGILLISIFVPFFWTPPLLANWWFPFLWFVFNSYLLGSPTFAKEIVYSALGLTGVFIIIFFANEIIHIFGLSNFPSAVQYLRIALYGYFFTFLYLIVFKQMVPFDIYQYVREQNNV